MLRKVYEISVLTESGLGSLHSKAWLTLSRAFGQLGGHCADSDSRCIKWGTPTSLHEVANLLSLFLVYHGALLWDVSRLPPIWVVPYSCLLLFWHTLHLMLDFYLHHNVTTWPIFDLQLCLNVDILPWANYSSPGIFFFLCMRKIIPCCACYLTPTQHSPQGDSS